MFNLGRNETLDFLLSADLAICRFLLNTAPDLAWQQVVEAIPSSRKDRVPKDWKGLEGLQFVVAILKHYRDTVPAEYSWVLDEYGWDKSKFEGSLKQQVTLVDAIGSEISSLIQSRKRELRAKRRSASTVPSYQQVVSSASVPGLFLESPSRNILIILPSPSTEQMVDKGKKLPSEVRLKWLGQYAGDPAELQLFDAQIESSLESGNYPGYRGGTVKYDEDEDEWVYVGKEEGRPNYGFGKRTCAEIVSHFKASSNAALWWDSYRSSDKPRPNC